MDIVFVILHYKTYEDTLACIASIKKNIDTENYMIVVVDNASNNGSIEKIEIASSSDKHVLILKNTINLGFSRGLNEGIEYAREKFSPCFIACVNNDILIISKKMFHTISQKYNQTKFAVLGPMIISGDYNCTVNPVAKKLLSLKEVDHCIKHEKRLKILAQNHLLSIYKWMKKHIKNTVLRKDYTIFLNDQIDYQLHGSCLIFSPIYFDYFEGLDSRTFLYCEENILHLHILRNGLHTLYTPDIIIFHKEDSSTKSELPNSNDRVRFICENQIKSYNIYKSIYLEYEKSK